MPRFRTAGRRRRRPPPGRRVGRSPLAARGGTPPLVPSDLPAAERQLVEFLLLLPVAALVCCVVRNVIGLHTYGTFAPALLGLAFREVESAGRGVRPAHRPVGRLGVPPRADPAQPAPGPAVGGHAEPGRRALLVAFVLYLARPRPAGGRRHPVPAAGDRHRPGRAVLDDGGGRRHTGPAVRTMTGHAAHGRGRVPGGADRMRSRTIADRPSGDARACRGRAAAARAVHRLPADGAVPLSRPGRRAKPMMHWLFGLPPAAGPGRPRDERPERRRDPRPQPAGPVPAGR